MTKPLLSATALAAIRRVGEGQFQTEIQIFRGVPLTVSSPGYDPLYDYGDDDDEEIEPYEGDTYGTALAWFHSTLQNAMSDEDGQIAPIDLHEIRAAFGTDIRPHDIIRRVDNGDEFVVIDTNGDDTWAEKLKATVRRRE